MSGMPVRERLARAVRVEGVVEPVFAVYDWFVRNRPQVEWKRLFSLGLGEINHADIIRYERPHAEIMETWSDTAQGRRRDVRYITDRGELHEWFLGEWRQEYLIKSADDYRLMARVWEDVELALSDDAFLASEAAVGDNGITMPPAELARRVREMAAAAGPTRYCLMISEEVPPEWEATIPVALRALTQPIEAE